MDSRFRNLENDWRGDLGEGAERDLLLAHTEIVSKILAGKEIAIMEEED